MRRLMICCCMPMVVAITGCANPMIGTWTADKNEGSSSPIARATFSPDGTFTAEAEYGGGKTHAMSGTYQIGNDKLKLKMDGTSREYGCKVSGDTLTMTHNGKSATMTRMKGEKPTMMAQ